MTTVTELKDAGSAAFKEKNYESAISLWSDALSKKGCDVDMERSLLSNRSYAFMHSGNLRAALLDADKCIAVDKSWIKGHLRKAEVCYRMAQFKDSVAAYEAAFKVLQLVPCTHSLICTHFLSLSIYSTHPYPNPYSCPLFSMCVHNQCDPSARTTYSTGYSKAQRSLAGSTARSSANTAGPGSPSVLPSSTLGWVAGKVRDGTYLIFMAHITCTYFVCVIIQPPLLAWFLTPNIVTFRPINQPMNLDRCRQYCVQSWWATLSCLCSPSCPSPPCSGPSPSSALVLRRLSGAYSRLRTALYTSSF
jgi:hypothetical protein